MFDFMLEQLVKINRALQQPFSSVILIGVEGLGKFALSRLAIFICKYTKYELSMSKEFDREDWKHTLRQMVKSAAMEKRVNVLNIRGNQIQDEIVLIDLNCLLKNGLLPELVPNSELKDIIA